MKQTFENLTKHVEWARLELEAVNRYTQNDERTDMIFRDAIEIFGHAVAKNNASEVMDVLRMILSGTTMSPIEDVDDEFIMVADNIYQSKRYQYLYYLLDQNTGKKFLIDQSGVLTMDIHRPKEYILEPFALNLFYKEYHKIDFPYLPEENPWVLYIEGCDANKIGTYDTLGVLYTKSPNSSQLKEIKRFFKRASGTDEWEEIKTTEYAFRCRKGGLLDE